MELASLLEKLESVLSGQVEVQFTKSRSFELEKTKRLLDAEKETPYVIASSEVDVASLLSCENVVLKSPTKEYTIENAGDALRSLILVATRRILSDDHVTSELKDDENLLVWIASNDHRRLVDDFDAIRASLELLNNKFTEAGHKSLEPQSKKMNTGETELPLSEWQLIK